MGGKSAANFWQVEFRLKKIAYSKKKKMKVQCIKFLQIGSKECAIISLSKPSCASTNIRQFQNLLLLRFLFSINATFSHYAVSSLENYGVSASTIPHTNLPTLQNSLLFFLYCIVIFLLPDSLIKALLHITSLQKPARGIFVRHTISPSPTTCCMFK